MTGYGELPAPIFEEYLTFTTRWRPQTRITVAPGVVLFFRDQSVSQ